MYISGIHVHCMAYILVMHHVIVIIISLTVVLTTSSSVLLMIGTTSSSVVTTTSTYDVTTSIHATPSIIVDINDNDISLNSVTVMIEDYTVEMVSQW